MFLGHGSFKSEKIHKVPPTYPRQSVFNENFLITSFNNVFIPPTKLILNVIGYWKDRLLDNTYLRFFYFRSKKDQATLYLIRIALNLFNKIQDTNIVQPAPKALILRIQSSFY